MRFRQKDVNWRTWLSTDYNFGRVQGDYSTPELDRLYGPGWLYKRLHIYRSIPARNDYDKTAYALVASGCSAQRFVKEMEL